MSLEDINNLPDTISKGQNGHRENHETIHRGMKEIKTELEGKITKQQADGIYANSNLARQIDKYDHGLTFMQNVRFESKVRAGLAGDSTGNAPDEWFDLLVKKIGAEHPDQKYSIAHWNDTNQSFDAATVVQSGTAVESGVKARDTFNRTGPDLAGSKPDLGANWSTDGSNANGDWTLDGAAAVNTSETTRGGQYLDMATSGDMETRIDLTIDTTTVASARSFRVYTAYKSTTDHVFAQVTISQTTGAANLSIWKRISNTASKITASTDVVSTAIAASTANQAITVRFKIEGRNLTFTVKKGSTTDTVTAQLSAAEAEALAGASKGGIGVVQSALLPIRMTLFELSLLNALPAPEALFYNTSVSGTRLEYQQARLAQLFPERLDVLFLSAGHNYQQRTPEELHSLIDSFVNDFHALWPDVPIVITGQNPEYAPATARLAHNARQQSLAMYARSRGFGYIPTTAKMLAESDKGRSLVQADGIHPVVGETGTGSAFWRDVAYDYLKSL